MRYFKITAKSDLIFIASSNTEGNIRYLDFIPGSVIMGAVANMGFDKKLIDGSVKFYDADILINGRSSVKIPLVYHYKKLHEEEGIFNSFYLTKDNYEKAQYKQIRSGYMNENFEKKTIEFNYSQKSARDYKKGRSAEGKMFGYKSIPRGSEFIFCVNTDDRDIIEKIKNVKYLGKSKRNEYGRVEIKEISEKYAFNVKEESFGNETVLYFKSRLCLIDKNGNPTYDLKEIHPSLSKENIEFNKNKLRYYRYSPYNYIRGGYDSERLVIDKGSVVVLKNINQEVIEDLKKGIGAYLNEGFGDVLINPGFLKKEKVTFRSIENEISYSKDIKLNSKIANVLLYRKEQNEKEVSRVKKVNSLVNGEFARWFFNITPSQWGNIRKLANNDNYVEKIEDYISTGLKRWRDDQIRKLLDVIRNEDREFVKLLANYMAKAVK